MRAKSANIRKNVNIDQELQHQNQKAKILEQDRKNFWRQAQEIKQKNKQEIEKLKIENKRLRQIRDQFISNKKSKPSLTKTAQNLSFSSNQNLTSNIKDQNYLRRMLDKKKHQTKAKKTALFILQDKLKQVQDNKLGQIEQSPLMRNIRLLENRLDKVMIKYNEAQSMQKTYEQVVKRLKEQRVGYDSQLAAIESSLKGRQHDFEELLLLAHDATHAKQAAYAQLKRFQQRRVTVQQMRVKYINNKKEEACKDKPQTIDANFKTDSRMPQNKAAATFSSTYQHDENYQKQELQDYEDAFRKLKQVTGVIDANQIIQKFKTQGLTTNSLEELKDSYKKRIEQLKNQKEQLKIGIEQIKFLKETGEPERKRLDQIQNDLAKVTNLFQRTTLKSERLSKSTINLKAGIQHLKEMIEFYKKEGQNQGQNSVEDDLKNLNQKLRKMYDVVKNDPQYMKRSYQTNAKSIHNHLNEHHADYISYQKMNDQQESEQDVDDTILDKRIK